MWSEAPYFFVSNFGVAAKRVLADMLAEDPLILKEPAPFFGVSTLGESGVQFAVQVWVQRSDVRRVRFDLPEKIKLAFDQHGITPPYPQRTVHIQNSIGPAPQHAGTL
jgi:small conductance mechanosensitive channel